MCEVEFWEVFFRRYEGFISWLALNPHTDCQIADLGYFYQVLLLLFVNELQIRTNYQAGFAMIRQYLPTPTPTISRLMLA